MRGYIPTDIDEQFAVVQQEVKKLGEMIAEAYWHKPEQQFPPIVGPEKCATHWPKHQFGCVTCERIRHANMPGGKCGSSACTYCIPGQTVINPPSAHA